MRIVVAALTVIAVCQQAHATETVVAGFALPSRHHAGASERTDRVASALARALSGRLSPRSTHAPPGLDEPTFARAEKLYQNVSFDAAATVSDQILQKAARNPDRVTDGARLIALLIQRASLALARGEVRRADELLDRLLRYDPSVVLQPLEADPSLERELSSVRRRLDSRPALESSLLGDGCRIADVVVVARSLAHDVEFARFDNCRLVASVVVSQQGSDESVVGALMRSTPVDTTPPFEADARARDRFEVGWGLYRIGKYEAAIREFTAGYALSSKPVFLLDIAQAYRKLKDFSHAKEMYEKFLTEAAPNAGERAEVQKLLAEINEPSSKAAAAVGREHRSPRAMRIAGLTTLAAGIVTVGLGGVFAGLAKNTRDDATRPGSTFSPDTEDRLNLHQTLDASFFAVGGAAIAVGVVVTILGYRRHR